MPVDGFVETITKLGYVASIISTNGSNRDFAIKATEAIIKATEAIQKLAKENNDLKFFFLDPLTYSRTKVRYYTKPVGDTNIVQMMKDVIYSPTETDVMTGPIMTADEAQRIIKAVQSLTA
jgi:hypothetical protein